LACAVTLGFFTSAPAGQSLPPVDYRLSLPAPQHRWLSVDVRFVDVGEAPLHVRMSSASPGRYARHEFAKNLIEIDFTGARDGATEVVRRGPAHWEVAGHGGEVRVRYRLFGDRVDGTYMAVDATHAHLNAPATLLWAEGLEDRAARVTLEPPDGEAWHVATQLFPTDDPLTYTAPNLAYLLDSPIEFSDFALHTFTVPDPADSAYRPTFRVAVHHAGGDAGLAAYVAAVESIVRETVPIFGEFPRFETGTYTFIADYLPTASGDAMEHRNSTVLTAPAGLDNAGSRTRLLGSVSHEFVHAWNVERIRPRSLEPFDFTGANVSGELWLAEGFTNYYGALILQRAGLVGTGATLARFEQVIDTVTNRPGRLFRSVVEMSRMAPFTDAATAIDPTNFDNTFISYYVWGEAIALGLDLALRERTGGRATLDDYMRALWERFGRPGDGEPGVVATPYSPADAEAVLGRVAGDPAFARDFFARYINGREVIDYARLLEQAGIVMRPAAPGRATLGAPPLGGGMRVIRSTAYGSPLHEAGLDRNDEIASFDGRRVTSASDLRRLVAARQPGDRVRLGYRRQGRDLQTTVTLAADNRFELALLESTGARPASAQLAFRRAWLGSRQ
jgi:predicted metalloprotease with PDZ domain